MHRHAPQSRRYLAFLLWPDSSESQARTNLRNLLHVLRQALPDADSFVHLDAQNLQWNLESPFSADVVEFEEVAAQASDSIALRRAVDLYEGPLLPGCYDDWIQPERERLQERFVEVLEQLILMLEQENNPRAAIHFAERLLHVDPLREATYRQLMRLYAQRGDRLGVVRIYQTCVDVMKRELNVQVSESTRAAYEELIQVDIASIPADESPVRPHRSNLPIPLSSFIGREQSIADLDQILAQRSNSRPRTRLITLTGTGGCGKTRLAIETASHIPERFQDGVWYVDLAPLSDPQLVPQAVAAVFGLQEYKGRAILEMLVGYLETRSLLLILDNCEHLLDACARLVEKLLQTCSQIQIMATSRERLSLTGEMVWNVPPLSLPDVDLPETLEVIKRFEAVRLFIERAAAVLPTFQLNHQNAASIAQVCQRLDGIPLAIELAAARVRLLSVEQIAGRLEADFQILTGGSRTALPRQQAVRASIEWSYQLLSEPEQALLRRLSVFAGGWTLEAAEQVCADCGNENISTASMEAGHSPAEFLDLLARLVNKSLVVPDQRAAAPRYYFLEMVRQYAHEQLVETGETGQVSSRHLAFYQKFAETNEPLLHTGQRLEALAQLSVEVDNYRTALTWALTGAQSRYAEAGLRLASALQEVWVSNGLGIDGRGWLDRLLSTTAEDDPRQLPYRAKALFVKGYLCYVMSDWIEALDLFERSASIYQSINDPGSLALTLAWQSVSLLWTDRKAISRITALQKASVAYARSSGDRWVLAFCLISTGSRHLAQGEWEACRKFAEESLALFKQTGDRWTAFMPLTTLGYCCLYQGDIECAHSFFEASAVVGREENNLYNLMWSAACLGDTAYLQKDYPAMANHFQEFQATCKKIGFRAGQAWGIRREGVAYRRSGEFHRAAQCFQDSLNMVLSLENDYTKNIEIKLSLCSIAGLALDTGHPAFAARLFGAIDQLDGQLYGYSPNEWVDPEEYQRDISLLQTLLHETEFQTAREEGRHLTLEQTIQEAKQVCEAVMRSFDQVISKIV